MAKVQSKGGEERKSQESWGKHVAGSRYDKRRESEEKKIKDVKPEFDIEAFIEQQISQGKTAGHIYFEIQLRNAKREDEEELKTKENNETCPKIFNDIQKILETTNTYEDFDYEIKKYKKNMKNGFDFWRLDYCYGKQFRNLLININNQSKPAQTKQLHAMGIDNKKEDSFDQLYKDIQRKPVKKGLLSRFADERNSLMDRFDIQKQIEQEEARFKFGDKEVVSKFQKTFGIRSGQHGTTLPSKEEQQFAKLAYGSFYDLANAINLNTEEIGLGIDPKGLNLRLTDEMIEEILEKNNNLAIAFASRGHGKAKAHYEPSENIINLTRTSGNGAIAHEWGHALDMKLGNTLSKKHHLNLSELNRIGEFDDFKPYQSNDPTWKRDDFLVNLDDLREKIITSPFCTGIGMQGRKTIMKKGREGSPKHDYYSNPKECFARAFESYVQDKLDSEGKPNQFLVLPNKTDNPKSAIAKFYPQGDDRKEINQLFDNMFNDHQRLKKLIIK